MKKKVLSWGLYPVALRCTLVLFQVVQRIHVLMTGKLQTCFSRDSECLNHSTWIWHLSFSFLFYAHWKKHHMHLAVIIVLIICVDRYQLPDNDEMLTKWPGCEINIHWIEKWAWRHENPAQGKTWDGHGKLPIFFKSMLSHSDVFFSVISPRFHFKVNFSLIRVSVYFSKSPLSLFDKGIGWW